MKRFATLGLALTAMVMLVGCNKVEGKSTSLKPGDKIGAFNVVKIAGAPDDEVAVGQELCYRCKYGTKPMVIVFARGTGPDLSDAVKALDAAVADDKKVFVNILGENKEAAEKSAKAFAESLTVTNVPIVVPVDAKNGPEKYGLDPNDQVTIIVAARGEVTAKHTLDKLDEATVKKVIDELNAAAGS